MAEYPIVPEPVDIDELPDEELLPDEQDEAGVDGNGRPEAAALTALRHLGPATAREIANEIDRDPSNVSTRLRQLEQAGRVRRTGRMVNLPNARGGPQVEWELMPANGTPTDPTLALTGTGPVEERERRLVGMIERANGSVERLENELAGAKARADQAEQRARTAEERRQQEAARADRAGDTESLRKQLRESTEREQELQQECHDRRLEMERLQRERDDLADRLKDGSETLEGGGHSGRRDARSLFRSAARSGPGRGLRRACLRPDRAADRRA